ncbi:uncharacterized protein EV420DRAFT_1487108 [Desarmillaria tabescens]|uniref:Uncharacterized protein n=1 Tax=Armillaria tabescens TaxID=1929756 RepID=A0AA39MJR1_ARMTA|nr:uncharacterized protein EV420DRAFT_1487108 [Desarmillaria tabescens]KAK0437431.1 hypothetical protein EV420DRAFT_1487108 [Desarmillaria tabescens]
MDDPSHPERQLSQSRPQTPTEQHPSTSPIPGAYSSDPVTHPYHTSSTSLQSEASQEAKKKGLWGKVKEALSTSGMRKGGGSKASSRMTGVGKKELTPIPEVSGSPQKPTLTGQELMTLETAMESLSLGPPSQIPPEQIMASPLDTEWLKLARERNEQYQLPGILGW